jgi:hypothetical protein
MIFGLTTCQWQDRKLSHLPMERNAAFQMPERPFVFLEGNRFKLSI